MTDLRRAFGATCLLLLLALFAAACGGGGGAAPTVPQPPQPPPGPTEPTITWTKLETTGSQPFVRGGYTAAYDAGAGRCFFVGGTDFLFWYGDVWLLDPAAATTARWTKQVPTGDVPTGRAFHAMAYDTARSRYLVFGGQGTFGRTNEVYALRLLTSDTVEWTRLGPTGDAPTARSHSMAAYLPGTDQLLVAGGTDGTKTLDEVFFLSFATSADGVWSKATNPLPTACQEGVAVRRAATQEVWIVGGQDADGTTLAGALVYREATGAWRMDGGGWTCPGLRAPGATMFDAGQSALFGGFDTMDRADAWILDLAAAGDATRLDAVGDAPGARRGMQLVKLPAADDVLVYGGFGSVNGDVFVGTVSNLP
jgi:hypothetical protein